MPRGSGRGSGGGFGSRGSSGGSRGGGPRGGAPKGSSGGGSRGSAPQPKGQVRDGKKVTYSIKDSGGNTKYIGTTNNPSRRASEHRESGRLQQGDKLEVQTRPISKGSAERVERSKLADHRRNHGGENPRHNTTNDGRFHP